VTCLVHGGSNGPVIERSAYNPLAANFTSSFTTAAAPLTAMFRGPSLVNEGTTTAQVSFSNVIAGTGDYTYSYNFNDTGTFEISGNTSRQCDHFGTVIT
jgi:hypothetical protein